jgi:hypothetical protein
MLRITMSVSGEGATKYFDAALATSKYYGSERGQWGGKGAELLGLRGDVHRKDFIALASNKQPGTDETLTVRMKTTRRQKEVVIEEKANTWKLEDGEVSNRRAGYDFCFSVPEARDLVKKTGMDFADAFAQVKGKLGAESREAKSVALLDPEEQLANWRAQMTPEERTSLMVESVKGKVSQNLLEGPIARNLALEHLFERASVARELHEAGMLLRRGIGRVSVEEARLFT